MLLLPLFSAKRIAFALMVLVLAATAHPSRCAAQTRTKKPDRGIYQPPLVAPLVSRSAPLASQRNKPQDRHEVGLRVVAEPPRLVELMRDQRPSDTAAPTEPAADAPPTLVNPNRPLVDVECVPLTDQPMSGAGLPGAGLAPSNRPAASELKRVAHQEKMLQPPIRSAAANNDAGDVIQAQTRPSAPPDDTAIWSQPVDLTHDAGCDGCPDCQWSGCDSMGCDAIGCDSMGGCNASWMRRWSNASCRLNSDCWFGGVELMLMFRKGDGLPPLVTTSTSTDPDVAGELGGPGTQIVVGNETILKDMTAGGRFTLGTWIDNRQCRSLVLRGWFAGEETYGFHANENMLPTIARPFFNVSDNRAPAQDTLLVAFPNRASGSINVAASSDVHGADLQVRQFWYGKYGATVDLLYGYQYMRVSEDLSISSTSTSLDDDFAPIGSVISVSDVFDTENVFNGGQIGMAARYREGCWSFDGTLKTGFGNLQRRARRNGSTLTSIDGVNAIDPNGLLVRSTNAGTITDNTFGWVPELDLSLGWQQYPRFDVTFGYHIIAMTEALQPTGAIDPNLAVNLSDPPTGQQRPTAALRYNTYFVQGIHFGLQYVY